MPLTAFQAALAELLAVSRSSESYLAGGAAQRANHVLPEIPRLELPIDILNFLQTFYVRLIHIQWISHAVHSTRGAILTAAPAASKRIPDYLLSLFSGCVPD